MNITEVNVDFFTGFKVLEDEQVDQLPVSDRVKAIVKAANDLGNHGYTDQTGEFYKVDQRSMTKLITALALLRCEMFLELGEKRLSELCNTR